MGWALRASRSRSLDINANRGLFFLERFRAVGAGEVASVERAASRDVCETSSFSPATDVGEMMPSALVATSAVADELEEGLTAAVADPSSATSAEPTS